MKELIKKDDELLEAFMTEVFILTSELLAINEIDTKGMQIIVELFNTESGYYTVDFQLQDEHNTLFLKDIDVNQGDFIEYSVLIESDLCELEKSLTTIGCIAPKLIIAKLTGENFEADYIYQNVDPVINQYSDITNFIKQLVDNYKKNKI